MLSFFNRRKIMGGIVSQLCGEISLPRMYKAKQFFDQGRIDPEKISEAVFAELSKPELGDPVKPGKRIAISCGSRGVANIPIITKAMADFVKSRGAQPFIIPAMGSHGGATAEGQKRLLAGYGVTEESAGCPILSSMETLVIGKSEEGPDGKVYEVRIDKNAAEADGIIVAGRIKPHTDFHGPYESGLMKMMAIGLGKREGADICHQLGFDRMAQMVPLFGKTIIKNAPVLLGLAILENAYSETCRFEAMRADEIEAKEPPLLREARRHLPLIPFDHSDILVVDRIGKDISGDGMDPNITGASPCSPLVHSNFSACRTVLLDLSPESHGSAMGMGAAHVITRRFFEKIDYDATYVNALTARIIDFARIPAIAENDREAIQLALRTCTGYDRDQPRIIRIRDSLHTEIIYISEALEKEARTNKALEILEGPHDWPFDKNGNLW